MPALISTTAAWQTEPLAVQLSAYWQNLAAGVLDTMLLQASSEAVEYAGWPLLTPPSTTAVGGTSSGADSITVAAATNIGPLDVLSFPDGSTVEVQDAEVTTDTSPYAGTVYLNDPLPADVADGAAITVYRQYRYRVSGKATEPNDLAGGLMTQQAQIAIMHAPALGLQTSARKIFLPYRPLHALATAYQELPWTNEESVVDTSGFDLNKGQGWVRLPIGFYNPPQCIWRLVGSWGYRVAPYDLRHAVHLLLAANVAKAANPTGALEVRSDSGMARFTRPSLTPGSPLPLHMWIEEAHSILDSYKPLGF